MKKILKIFILSVFVISCFNPVLSIAQKPQSNPELARDYFKKWHGEDVGTMIPVERLKSIWSEIYSMPSEPNYGESVNSWNLLGPVYMNVVGTSARWSGRILDIEVDNGVSTRVASASGGLWGFSFIFPVPLSDKLSTLAIGSFDSHPTDPNTIVIGTGEPYQRTGNGVFLTTNGGNSFSSLTFPSGTPGSVFKIRYDLVNTNVIYCASDIGFYKSTNSGTNWINYLSTGLVSDFEIDPVSNNIMYAAVWGFGVYKSTNSGVNWALLQTGGIPSTNVGRTDISVHKNNPNIIFASMGRNDNNNTLGLFKSTNGGTNWTNVTPDPNYLGGQAWYDNVVSVSPVDPNIVLAGGVGIFRSTNGGGSWTPLADENIHADQHSMVWNNAGSGLWAGHDGGMSYSNDNGATFSTSANFLPITQFVNIDVGVSNTNVLFGGSQDNGMARTTNGGSTWDQVLGGDGGGVAIDPNNSNNVFISLGLYGGNWAFRRLKSTNTGSNWSFIDNGIDNSTQWYHKIRSDLDPTLYLYANSGNFVYRSTTLGTAWTKLNTTAFPGTNISNLNVSRYVSPTAIVYASLNPGTTTGEKLRVHESGVWYERSTGFPGSVGVRGVKPHPVNINIAYALMNGLSAGNKIFKSTNRGINWTNISGNLPNVPMGDMVPHPFNDNLLYVGTEMGCYKSTNGGVNWMRWNNGLPDATIVTEMVTIDSLAARSKYYVVAGTYGRSIFTREIAGDDPVGINNVSSVVPKGFNLKQNYPNPFNPVTNISFDLPLKEFVNITIYDAAGKEISSLVNQNLNPGVYEYSFDASAFSTGVYFYKISAGKFVETKKMMLIK